MTIELAEQVANLLNKRNKLIRPYTGALICRNENDYIYIQKETELVGFCQLKKVQWYQHEICHLSVNEKYERKGYGSKIIDLAIERAKEDQARIVQCTIRRGNEGSINLFTKKGFKRTSTFHYTISKNDVHVYQKVISESNEKY